MNNNYFFIDGSALLSDVKKYKDSHLDLKDKKFDPVIFSDSFFGFSKFEQLHEGSYRRTVFYFVKDDERTNELIKIPDFAKAGVVRDLEIRHCGKKIPTYEKAKEWLEEREAPGYVMDSLYKSEKAVDTQICCDALVLLSLDKLDRLFLYSNDYDFIPLCLAIKTMGANINIVKLTDLRVNKCLIQECDGLCSFTDHEIYRFFGAEYKQQSIS